MLTRVLQYASVLNIRHLVSATAQTKQVNNEVELCYIFLINSAIKLKILNYSTTINENKQVKK